LPLYAASAATIIGGSPATVGGTGDVIITSTDSTDYTQWGTLGDIWVDGAFITASDAGRFVTLLSSGEIRVIGASTYNSMNGLSIANFAGGAAGLTITAFSGIFAEEIIYNTAGNLTLQTGANGALSAGALWNDASGWMNVLNATNITLTGSPHIGTPGTTPVSIETTNFYVGTPGGTPQGIVLSGTAGSRDFTITAAGLANISGNMQVSAGYGMTLVPLSGDSLDVGIGGVITNNGNMQIGAANNRVGDLAAGGLSIGANSTTGFFANDITIGGSILNASGATTTLSASNDLTIGALTNAVGAGTVTLSGLNITTGAIFNNSTVDINADDSLLINGNLFSTGIFTGNAGAGGMVVTGDINVNNGTIDLDILGDLTANSLINQANFIATVSGDTVFANGIDNAALMNFSLTTGTLDLGGLANMTAFTARTAGPIGGTFYLNITDGALHTGAIGVSATNAWSAPTMDITAVGITVDDDIFNTTTNMTMNITSASYMMIGGDVINSADTWLSAATTLSITGDVTHSGVGALRITSADAVNIAGDLLFSAAGTSTTEPDVWIDGLSLAIDGNIMQSAGNTIISTRAGTLGTLELGGMIWMAGGTLDIRAGAGLDILAPISQSGGELNLWGQDISVTGSVMNNSGDMNIYAQTLFIDGNLVGSDGITINQFPGVTAGFSGHITGDVSGAITWYGINSLTVGGDFHFGTDSVLFMNAPTGFGAIGTIDTTEGSPTFGVITNGTAGPIMTVSGQFITDLDFSAGAAFGGQLRIATTEIMTPGSAIWLVNAAGGIYDTGDFGNEIIDLIAPFVQFCNRSGTICFDYADLLNWEDETLNGLPLFLSVRNGGQNLYLVFDERFGGPQMMFLIQPIVGKDVGHTHGEWASAGAIDDLMYGTFYRTGFTGSQPLNIMPSLFTDTPFEEMAHELFLRMRDYLINPDMPENMSRFTRLFQPRELDVAALHMNMNEREQGRALRNRMAEEFTWNRHRNIARVWTDFSGGLYDGHGNDGVGIDGNRASATIGVDVRSTRNMIFGVMAHASYTTASMRDTIDISHGDVSQIGNVSLDMNTLHVGLGAYMQQRMSQYRRMYARLNLNADIFDFTRNQTFVDEITGDGTAFSIMSEWGMFHDLHLRYWVGNVFVRAGYNFGIDMTSSVAGTDYMRYQHGGHLVLTPGYELMVQRRVYMSPWIFVRPFASVGVEYDILGMDRFQFRFAPALRFTEYSVETNPLWLRARAGLDFNHARGGAIGIEVEYQHNEFVQMYNLRLSGSLRF